MIRRPPRSTRTDTRFPYTTLFRSEPEIGGGGYDRYHGFPLCSPYPCKGEGGEVESFRGSWRKCRATCIETGDLTTYQPVGMSSRMTTTHTPSQDRPQRGNARAKLIAAAHQTVRRNGYADRKSTRLNSS